MENNKLLDVDDLKYIKKHYGEKFARMIRGLFPSLLEHRGLLATIISESFEPTRSLYDDIIENEIVYDFKKFVNTVAKDKYGIDTSKEIETKCNGKTPEELLSEAGYVLFPECLTQDDVLQFTGYYAPGEELCSFDGDRTQSCRVWFAVKKDATELKREDFITPRRQDEYGTSVISIQFSKDESCTLSIKNRYNHTVAYPDSTFSNNLDNIIPGLTDAFATTYGVREQNENLDVFPLESYIEATNPEDGSQKYYRKSISSTDGGVLCYFCENNVVINKQKQVYRFDRSRYILAENYLIDLKEKTITGVTLEGNPPKPKKFVDSFVESIGDVTDIKVSAMGDDKIITFSVKDGEDVVLKLNNHNEIIEYHNQNVTEIGDGFLHKNKNLQVLNIPNVKSVGRRFLYANQNFNTLNAPNLESVGDCFLQNNQAMSKLNLPNLKKMGAYCLTYNVSLNQIYLPECETIDRCCFCGSINYEMIYLPNVTTIGSYSFNHCESVQKIKIDKLSKLWVHAFYRFEYRDKLVSIAQKNAQTSDKTSS